MMEDSLNIIKISIQPNYEDINSYNICYVN